jgi:ABC-type transporter Mla MlaB component
MLRITTHSTADSITFQLEGRLVGPWVTELRDCWRRTPCDGKRVVRIDLRAVTYVDAAGEELLADLYRQGADLFAIDCQMKAVVAEIENNCVNPHWDERGDHETRTSNPTPSPRRFSRRSD